MWKAHLEFLKLLEDKLFFISRLRIFILDNHVGVSLWLIELRIPRN